MWNAEVFPGGFGDVPSIFRRHGNSRMTNSNSTVETLHVNHLPVARNYVFSHSWCLYGISCFNNEDAAENSTRNKVQPISLTPIVFATPGNFLRAWFFHSFSTAPCFLLQRSALPRFVVADLSDTISLPHFPNYHGKFILRNLPCAKEGGSEASEFRSVFLLQLLLHILGDTTFPEEFGIPTVSAVLVRKDTVEVLIDQVRDQTGIQKGTRFLEELVCDVRSNPNTSFWRPDRKEASKRAKRMAKLGRVSDSVPSAANHTFNVLGGTIHIEYVTSHPQPICVESKTSEASNLDTSSIAGPSEAGSMEWKSEMKQNSMPQKNKQRKKTSRADVQHSVTKTPPTTSSGSTQPIEDAPLHLGRDSKVPEKVAIDDTSACNEVLTNARKDPPPVTDGPSCSTPPLKFEQKGKKKEFSARIKVTQEQHSEKSNQMPTNVTPLSQSAISAPLSAQAGTTETPSLPGRSQRPSLTSVTPITPSEVEAVHPSKASCDEKLSPSENVHHKAVSQKVVTGTNSIPPTGLNSLTTTKKRNSNLRYDEKATKSNRGSRLKVTRCVPEEQLSACAESQSKKRIAISVAMLAAVLLSLIFNFL